MNELERLAEEASDDCVVTEVIRPAAIVPEAAARAVLMELALRDVRVGGHWQAEPTVWRRYDRPWDGPDGGLGSAGMLGGIHVAYGIPTRWEITIYRATVSVLGASSGWTVEMLCDEALGYGDLTLASCPRADLMAPPRPFRHRGVTADTPLTTEW
ncbi:MAG: hypothetical protein ACRDTP_10070 [Mycobacteriales bacterium]